MKRADPPRAGASVPESGDAPTASAPPGRTRPETSTDRIDRAIRGGSARHGSAKAPSWGRVLLSTVRVWSGRKMPSRTLRRTGAVAIAVVVVVVGGVAVLANRAAAPKAASAGVDPESSARTAAASWIAHDIHHGTRMACDQAMCARLRSTGVSGGDLVELGGDATELGAAKLVVATRGVRDRFGASLAYDIAPDVLGIFGVGPSRVEVRQRGGAGGPTAHAQAKTREQKIRQRAGVQLLSVPRVHTTSDAMHELAAGEVDNRLVFTLARLARHHTINVASFSGRGPYTGIDIPERWADIDQVDGSAAISDNPAVRPAMGQIRAQHGMFRAAAARLIASGDSGGVLRITFTAPTPQGVLSGGLPKALRPQPKPKRPHKRATAKRRQPTAAAPASHGRPHR